MILPDVLRNDLDIVFCGTAAGDRSAERKAYYAGPGNQFYPTLHACGFTNRQLSPHEFSDLLHHNIGLTDLVKLVYGPDDRLKASDFDVKGFEMKIMQYQPKWVCFNGKKAASHYLGLKSSGALSYGLIPQTIGMTKLYVAPSTSGAARGFWDIGIWHALRKHVG